MTIEAEFRGGRADSAPALNEIHTCDESAAFKEVRFDLVVTMLKFPADRKGKPIRSLKEKLKWAKPMSEKGGA